MSTGGKARSGMMTFVAIIFVIAVVIVGVYTLMFSPGEPRHDTQPSPHAIDQRP